MPSNYPTAVDTFETLLDNVDIIAAADWNALADSIVAIENAIGANLSLLQTTGEIKLWSSSIELIPSGWLHCDGSAVSRNTFLNLFTEIGTTYGSGDGSTTFNLPNANDKFVIGAKQDDSGIAKSNLEGSLLKSGGSLTQPPTAGSQGVMLNINPGPNQATGPHNHTFTPPFVAFVFIIKT